MSGKRSLDASQAEKVFAKLDPQFDFEPSQRMYAGVNGQRLLHSDWRRDGVAGTNLSVAVPAGALENSDASAGLGSAVDDRVPRAAGLVRQRHDPDDLSGHLDPVAAAAADTDDGGGGPRRHGRTDRWAGTRRLPDRRLLLARIVAAQSGAGCHHHALCGGIRSRRLTGPDRITAYRLRRCLARGGVSLQPAIRPIGGCARTMVRMQ